MPKEAFTKTGNGHVAKITVTSGGGRSEDPRFKGRVPVVSVLLIDNNDNPLQYPGKDKTIEDAKGQPLPLVLTLVQLYWLRKASGDERDEGPSLAEVNRQMRLAKRATSTTTHTTNMRMRIRERNQELVDILTKINPADDSLSYFGSNTLIKLINAVGLFDSDFLKRAEDVSRDLDRPGHSYDTVTRW